MYAYAPNGTPIIGTLDVVQGTANALPDGFKREADGRIDCEYEGGTTVNWDSQVTVEREGEDIFVDQNGDEWPANQVILRETQLAEGEELEVPEPSNTQLKVLATYKIYVPSEGCRSLDSFSAEEKKKLRPAAEVLAMLDGNSFFGAFTDENGDDTHYEQYLPEAAALFATTSGCELASFVRGDTPLPAGGPFAGMIEEVRDRDGIRIVNCAENRDNSMLYRVSDIEWDVDQDDDIETDGGDVLSPALPTVLFLEVDQHEEGDEPEFADLLSDRYGFCIKSLSVDLVDDDADIASA